MYDFSFKSNDYIPTQIDNNLPEIIRNKIFMDDLKSANKTVLLEEDKKIRDSKKKINDKDKNILDHLTVLQKFRMQ